MAIDLTTKTLPYVDEIFSTESKASMVTNQDFEFTGANTVKVYKIGTATMNDYDRDATGDNFSRFGEIQTLDATTESMTLTKDRSFTFAIDKLDEDETQGALAGASALARQTRQVVIPEVDTRVFAVMCAGAGTKPTALALTASNIYGEIIKASTALDKKEVPDTDRVLVVTPTTYELMKKSPDIIMETDIGADMRKKGIIADLDGMNVMRVPETRVLEGFGFMAAHPSATVAPTKLAEYRVHVDPPFISGSLVEGRINYDAFVLENKEDGIYYQAIPVAD